MKRTVIILSLILGTSSIAMARPARMIRDDHDRDRVAIRHPRPSTWEAITGATQLERGGQTFTRLQHLGPMSRLRIDLLSGSANVRYVEIRFANGMRQTASVNQRLAPGNAAFDIDLTTRARIHSITVVGRGSRDGAYRLLGV